jgi:hypothetical protein
LLPAQPLNMVGVLLGSAMGCPSIERTAKLLDAGTSPLIARVRHIPPEQLL